MDMAADMKGRKVPLEDAGRPLCLSYHIKVVCNFNCSRSHYKYLCHQGNMAYLMCGKPNSVGTPPLVEEVDASSLGHTILITCSRKS